MPALESEASQTIGLDPEALSSDEAWPPFIPIPPESTSITGGVRPCLRTYPSELWVRNELEDDAGHITESNPHSLREGEVEDIGNNVRGYTPTEIQIDEGKEKRYAALFRPDPRQKKPQEEIAIGVPDSLGVDTDSIVEIGDGAQGRVFMANLQMTGERVAVKRYFDKNGNVKRWAQHEYNFIKDLEGHPSVIGVREVVHQVVPMYGDTSYISLQYGGVDLKKWRSTQVAAGQLDEDVVKQFAMRILLGLEHLQEKGVFHNDIKTGNILVNEDGVPRLIDFGQAGFAKRHGDDTEEVKHGGGTPGHRAPEQALRGIVTRETDLFTLLNVIVHLFTGKDHRLNLTFDMAPEFSADCFKNWLEDIEVELNKVNISSKAIEFVKAILKFEASEHLTLRQAMYHPWMQRIFDLKARFLRPPPALSSRLSRKRKEENSESPRPAKRV